MPIGSDTLVFGSKDGGSTVVAEDETLNRMMDELGRELNLKSHIGGVSKTQRLALPTDIEVHKGHDGNYYMLDFARYAKNSISIQLSLYIYILIF